MKIFTPADVADVQMQVAPWLRRVQIEDSIGNTKAIGCGVLGGSITGIILCVISNPVRWVSVVTEVGIIAVLVGIWVTVQLRRLRVELTMAVLESL